MEMGKCLDIVSTETFNGLSLMLQRYENCYYLRVENLDGSAILNYNITLDGQIVIDSYDRVPKSDNDLKCVKWAQKVIASDSTDYSSMMNTQAQSKATAEFLQYFENMYNVGNLDLTGLERSRDIEIAKLFKPIAGQWQKLLK